MLDTSLHALSDAMIATSRCPAVKKAVKGEIVHNHPLLRIYQISKRSFMPVGLHVDGAGVIAVFTRSPSRSLDAALLDGEWVAGI